MAHSDIRTQFVEGGNRLRLNVQTSGNPTGKPILFLHGFSQSGLVWNRQIQSKPLDEFFLVAMDLRGHGLSERPIDAYADSRLWADDVNAVIKTLGLRLPVLVGWSYAGVVISDYVSHYGEEQIAGTNWIGAVSRLGSPLVEPGFLGERFISCIPGSFSNNVEESTATLEAFVKACVNGEPDPSDLCFFLGSTVMVPPHVRQSLLSRTVNNDAIIASMRKPMLFSYGEEDAVALKPMREHMVGLASGTDAKLSVYPDVGHMPFWEACTRFNTELGRFRQTV